MEKAERVEPWEIAMRRLPTPVDEFFSIGFVGGNAIPALENLLARMVVPGSGGIGVVDPSSMGIVTGSVLLSDDEG